MKNMLIYAAMVLTTLLFTACGGWKIIHPTTATVKIKLTGTLPSAKAISGAAFTLTLPENVTPAMSNVGVVSGVVSFSGTFAGGTFTPRVNYTAAKSYAPGTLEVILANAAPTGVTEVGEVATITLQLANGAAPPASNFWITADTVYDAVLNDAISGMGVAVVGVTLQ